MAPETTKTPQRRRVMFVIVKTDEFSAEMGTEPNPNRTNRTRTHVEKTYIEPNGTRQCDEPEPNPNLLVGSINL